MPRVLFITQEIVPFHYGGIGTLFKSVARLLAGEGHTVAFLAREPAGFDETLYRRHYGAIPIDFVPLPTQDAGEGLLPDPLAYALALGRHWPVVAQRFRPEVAVFADFCAEGLIPLLRNRGATGGAATRFIVALAGSHGDLLPVYGGDPAGRHPIHGPHYRAIVAMEDLAVMSADAVLAPSAWVWGEVVRRTGTRRRAQIVPNTLDAALFAPQPPAAPPQAGQRRPLVFVGRLDRVKGADLLLEAYIDAARSRGMPDLVMIGRDCLWPQRGGTFLEFWRGRIPERLKPKITFTGQLPHEQIGPWMTRAGLCVFPSRWEAFGNVCLEAMALGSPVLASRRTGLGEVLGAPLQDLTFDLREGCAGLAAKLVALAGDPALRETLGPRLQARSREVMAASAAGWRAAVATGVPVDHGPAHEDRHRIAGRHADLLCALGAQAADCRPAPAAVAPCAPAPSAADLPLQRVMGLLGRLRRAVQR